jgi:hypothetical protein
LSGDWAPGYGPGRPRHEVWAWNGAAFTFHKSYYDPPVYRFQAVYDADDASLAGDYDAALALYQRAAFDESLLGWGPGQNPVDPQPGIWDPDERPRLEAYSRYRILLLHAINNRSDAAQIVYDSLVEKFPSGSPGQPFAELASAFWEEYSANQILADACAEAADYASAHEDDILVPISWPAYGDNEARTYKPEDICPFE